jgi:tetratricopeptide (TPR) repeat protein
MLVPYLAAAAVVGIISVVVFFIYPSSSPEKIADKYINEHFSKLGVSMSGTQDSIQAALLLYNEGNYTDALNRFETLATANPSNYKLKEYAGVVSLRLSDYDKALKYFRELEAIRELYANPGKFYVALTLLKRNGSGDVDEAKKLLKQVVDQGLENDADARELLEKF